MAPQGSSDVAFCTQVLERLIAGEELTHTGREATDFLPHDIPTGCITQRVGDVVFEMPVALDRQGRGVQLVTIESVNAHVIHLQGLGREASQGVKNRFV